MKKTLFTQVAVLASLAVILGLANNLRPSVHIPWVKEWVDYDSVNGTPEPPQNDAQHQNHDQWVDDETARAETQRMVYENAGITQIDLETARLLYQYARDVTLWIDARSPELYQRGHIKGAVNLFFYEKSKYLESVLQVIEETQPVALVFYCEGKDCADSRFLAEDFLAAGYGNLFDFRDGFDDWHMAELPVEGDRVSVVAADSGSQETPQDAEQVPRRAGDGMYLEEIVRDLTPFVLGVLLLLFWKKSRDSRVSKWAAAVFVGLFFVWAGLPKILNPLMFAKDIWNYDLAPTTWINLIALIMPWLEVLAGLCLIVGLCRRGAGFILAGLLVLFFVLVSINIIRGHEFNCGCTPAELLLTDIFVKNWNDKITLLMRDFGLFVMVLVGAGQVQRRTNEVKWPDPPRN